MVKIKGLEKFAPKDFPGYISSTVFLGGCNFRCPYCHNADLVLRPESLPSFPLDYFLSFLDARRNWLEGVCISGGEPLLDQELRKFLELLKERNLLVKIDTNGSFPSRLKDLVQARLVDFVAMDVKAPLERYQEVTRSNIQEEDIRQSIEIVQSSGLEYLFRTTVIPGLIEGEDIEKISELLSGAKSFQLQQFSPINTLDAQYLEKKPFAKGVIQEFARMAKAHFQEVRIEGI